MVPGGSELWTRSRGILYGVSTDQGSGHVRSKSGKGGCVTGALSRGFISFDGVAQDCEGSTSETDVELDVSSLPVQVAAAGRRSWSMDEPGNGEDRGQEGNALRSCTVVCRPGVEQSACSGQCHRAVRLLGAGGTQEVGDHADECSREDEYYLYAPVQG